MAFDELLADRIKAVLNEKNSLFEEKQMMGGLAFMVNNKMCVGVVKNKMMARIDPDIYEDQ